MSDGSIGKNDPEAYERAADRVTADGDRQVWVVERAIGDEFQVAAVLPTYEDAQVYMNDYRDFIENCPEDSNEELGSDTVAFRCGSRKSPTKLFENWPPEGDDE